MGLSRCTEADLITADEAVANRCGPRRGGRGPNHKKPVCGPAGADPSYGAPKQS